jgi:hypothetical protein
MKFWQLRKEDYKRLSDMLKNKHYARRMPQIKFAFVCSDEEEILGCCTFSIPASYTLCKGVCGEEWKRHVLELSRLYLVHNEKNLASKFVAYSLRHLPEKPWIIVSYADSNVGHVGFVYQATNWLYTGRGNAEPQWRLKDGTFVSNTRRHIDDKVARMTGCEPRDYMQHVVQHPRLGKHRYVCFVGTKQFKKRMMGALNYGQHDYPKVTEQDGHSRDG